MSVLTFLSSPTGRLARAVVGAGLVAVASALGGWWWLLAAFGAVLVLVGVLDICLLAPLAGKPLRGTDFRAADRVAR